MTLLQLRAVERRSTGLSLVGHDAQRSNPNGLGLRGAANVAVITAEDTWSHKGVEYDAVVVDAEAMGPPQLYLTASRAAHELIVVR